MFNENIKEVITVELEDGKEVEMRVLLTFEDQENKENYVLYYDESGESEEVFPFLFDSEANELVELTQERQWDMAQEILEKFLDDQAQTE